MVVHPDRMRENLEPLARRRLFRARCCSSSRRRASRASRPTSGCSATRCGRSPSSAISRRCCWPTPTSTRVLPPAEIERAFDLDEQLQHVDDIFDRVFQPSGEGVSRMRARVFVTLKPSVFDPQGRDHRRRAALARLRRRRGRPAGQVLRARPRDDRGGAGAGARGRSRRQGARQSGDRELSHRGGLSQVDVIRSE